MAALEQQGIIDYLYSVYDGSAARELEARKLSLQKDIKKNNELYEEAKTLSGIDKDKAMALYQTSKGLLDKRKVTLNQIIQDYSDIASKMEAASLGMIEPEPVYGLSAFAISTVIITLAASAVVVALVAGVIELYRIYKGIETQSKGVIEQFASVIAEVKGSIGESSKLMLTMGVVGLVGLGGYLLYTLLENPGKVTQAKAALGGV